MAIPLESVAAQYLNSLPPPSGIDPIHEAKDTYDAEVVNERRMINLGIGVVLDTRGKDMVFESFREGEHRVAQKRERKAGYVPPVQPYLQGMQRLIFGGNKELYEGRSVALDAHGGTNADFLSFLFWRIALDGKGQFLLGHDSWPNFENMIRLLNLPGTDRRSDQELLKKFLLASANLEPSLEGLQKALKLSVQSGRIPIVITENGPQNGLGLHSDHAYQRAYLDLVKNYGGVVHFDDPYPGMGSTRESLQQLGVLGVMEQDWYMIRQAAEMEIPFSLASALTKTAGQYDSRIALEMLNLPPQVSPAGAQTLVGKLGRAVNSFTSKTHLAAGEVFSDERLLQWWLGEYREVLSRVHDGRDALQRHAVDQHIAHIIGRTRGMFATLPVPHEAADELIYHRDPGIVTVKGKSATYSGSAGYPVEIIRINVTGIPKAEEDEISAAVMQKVAKTFA